jgi:hypothetical protein
MAALILPLSRATSPTNVSAGLGLSVLAASPSTDRCRGAEPSAPADWASYWTAMVRMTRGAEGQLSGLPRQKQTFAARRPNRRVRPRGAALSGARPIRLALCAAGQRHGGAAGAGHGVLEHRKALIGRWPVISKAMPSNSNGAMVTGFAGGPVDQGFGRHSCLIKQSRVIVRACARTGLETRPAG